MHTCNKYCRRYKLEGKTHFMVSLKISFSDNAGPLCDLHTQLVQFTDNVFSLTLTARRNINTQQKMKSTFMFTSQIT